MSGIYSEGEGFFPGVKFLPGVGLKYFVREVEIFSVGQLCFFMSVRLFPCTEAAGFLSW